MIAPIAAALLAATTALGAPAVADQPKPCKDKTARVLQEAGFQGQSLRMAWSIVMRESKGQNLAEDSPWYSGALGVWQIQTSAHSGKPWWSRSAMLDPLRQSKIVYRYMSDKGRNWQPWGLTRDGQLDATQYGGWSSWQQQNWIMAPFQRFYRQFPKACR